MWGYAEGNATVVGIVVVVIAAAAIGYVVRRLWRRAGDVAEPAHGRGRPTVGRTPATCAA
jgi:hypothetical protein